MAAYLVADIEVNDPDTYESYRKGVAPTLEAFGGRFLVRGGKTQALEGGWAPARLVILEFPSMEKLREWYGSAQYAPLLSLRKKSAASKIVIAEGVQP